MTENPLSQLETNSKPDYYDKTSKKVIDFLIGFFAYSIVSIIVTTALTYALAVVFMLSSASMNLLQTVMVIVNLVVFVGVIVFCFKKGRKFVAIGMLSTFLVPLLLLGACALIFI